MDILQLEYFCSAAELENFTLAAGRHLIPQSAMSITIKRLERELNCPLFDRVGNRIRLNDAGRQFYVHARNCLKELQNARECVQRQEEPNGEIRILVLEERHVMADLIAGFRGKYPQIRFFVCHNLSEQPTDSFDLQVTSTPRKDPAYESVPLLKERFVLAVARNHPLAGRKKVSLRELEQEDFIMFPSGHSSNRLTMEACRKHGFVPRASILCDDPLCMRRYISAGLGVALVPSVAWAGIIDDKVALIPIEGEECFRQTMLECLRSSLSFGAVKLFFDYCTEMIGEL